MAANGFQKKEKKKGGKCCLFGCIILFLIPLVFIAAIIGLGMWFSSQVQPYLTDQPMEIPSVTLEETEQEQLMQRVAEFETATRTGQPATLELTGNELNAYIHAQPDYQQNNVETFFKIEDSQMKMLFSAKSDNTTTPRYLNFIATFDASENPGNFFKFDLTKLSFPDNTELTEEQKKKARDVLSTGLRLFGEQFAQDFQGGAMIADDRLIVVVGQEPVDPATQVPEDEDAASGSPSPGSPPAESPAQAN
jgi:flagellar basal body-associated protein FliL